MGQTPYNATVGYKYTHITNTNTVVVKPGPGMMASLVINSCGGASTITLYDSLTATGTVIGVPAFTATNVTPQKLEYDLNFNTGLVAVGTGTFDATIMTR